MVEGVEHLRPELHEFAFPEEREALRDRKVEVVDAGACALVSAAHIAEVGHSDVRIAPGADGWSRSHSGIEPLVEGMCAVPLAGADDVDAGAFGGTGRILCGGPAETGIERGAANERRHARDFPVIEHPLGRTRSHLRAELRQRVDVVGYELLRTVEAGPSVVAEAR